MDLYKFGSFLSAISILDRFVGQNHPLVFTHPCVLGGTFPTKTLVYWPKGVIRRNPSFPPLIMAEHICNETYLTLILVGITFYSWVQLGMAVLTHW